MAITVPSLLRKLGVLLAVASPASAFAIEEPKFAVEMKEGKIEIRRYESSIVAEVAVTGAWEDASNAAFRKLADFIFGNNTAGGKLAMTAPVGMEQKSQKIAMTTPVGMEQVGKESQASSQGPWRMSFTMPAEFTMDTLPRPKNPEITISQLPARTRAAIRFSGRGDEGKFQAKEMELRNWAESNGWKVVGSANYSQYNPPWTPGFLRRNEVLIPVVRAQTEAVLTRQ